MLRLLFSSMMEKGGMKMKIGKKSLLSTALICGLLIAPTPSFAYREYYDNGIPCTEAAYENGQLSYTLAKPITIHVDGKYVPSDVDPTIQNGRTMVPLRAAGEALGAIVSWDQGTQTAIAIKGDRTVRFSLYSNSYYINGSAYSTDVAPSLINGRTLLPLRVFAEALDADVFWNQDLYDVSIDTPVPDVAAPSIPAGTSQEVAGLIQKYYVSEDPSNPFLGSWYLQSTNEYSYPSVPYEKVVTDTYSFVSLCNGKYQTITVSIEDSTRYQNSNISIIRDANSQYYLEDGYDFLVTGYEPYPEYFRGPNRGWPGGYTFLVVIGDSMYRAGTYDPLDGVLHEIHLIGQQPAKRF